MSKFDEVWFKALEVDANPPKDGQLLKLTFKSDEMARWARFELYKVRIRFRRLSMENLPPDDPGYNRSAFDHIKIIQRDNTLILLRQESCPLDFDIEIPGDLKPRYQRKPTKSKAKRDENSS